MGHGDGARRGQEHHARPWQTLRPFRGRHAGTIPTNQIQCYSIRLALYTAYWLQCHRI